MPFPDRIRVIAALSSLLVGGSGFCAYAQATRFGNTAELEGDVTCGKGTGGPYSYLETAHFRIYVCSDENDPARPRFYRSFNTQGKLELSLTAGNEDPRQGRYTLFTNGGYQYILDSGNGQTQTALLIVKDPKGKTQVEEVAKVYLTQDDDSPISGTSDCQPSESQFVVASTANFQVSICGGDLPNIYIGRAKKDGSLIRLPLKSYEAKGEKFVAVNGSVQYILTRTHLQVLQGSKVLLKEPILVWN